jgi:2-polyprenyl-3-methyl-5-hydroxy-6-metoxy-1,4-benzoquinol methylase
LAEFRAGLQKSFFRFLDAPVGQLLAKYGASFATEADRYLGVLRDTYPERRWPDWCVDSFVRWNREIIREERAFAADGRYSREGSDFADVVADVYSKPEVMEGYYLSGLYLSYLCWPHHYELLRFFRRRFVEGLSGEGEVMEWGVGHGLFTLVTCQCWPRLRARAYDVSPSSIRFARRLLERQGVGEVTFIEADVLAASIPPADFLICGELLEHVPQPDLLLAKAAAALRPGGWLFLTGAINAPQVDHLFRFAAPQGITSLVERHDFAVIAAELLTHPNRRGAAAAPQVLALVAQKSRAVSHG